MRLFKINCHFTIWWQISNFVPRVKIIIITDIKINKNTKHNVYVILNFGLTFGVFGTFELQFVKSSM